MSASKENSTLLNFIHVETATLILLICEWSTWIFYLHVLMNWTDSWVCAISTSVDFNLLVIVLTIYGIFLFLSSIGFQKKCRNLFQVLIFLQFVRLWGFTGVVLSEASTLPNDLYYEVAFYIYYGFMLLLFYGEMYLSLKYFRYLGSLRNDRASPVIKIDMFTQNMFRSPVQEVIEVERAKYDSPVSLHDLFDYHDVVLV